jgi:hypothetical protein
MEYVSVESSTVDQIGYDSGAMEMGVIFLRGGREYLYSDVPEDVHAAFLAASSKGRFVQEVLKARGYPCRRVR